MPRGDEYHQPNAPDYEDEQDSDLELELQELGPRDAEGINGSAQQNRHKPDIPLRPLRTGKVRSFGRKAIRLGPAGDANQDLLEERDGERTGSSDGLNEEDATPLLPGSTSERPAQDVQTRPSRGFRFFGFGKSSQQPFLKTSGDDAADEVDSTPPRTVQVGDWPPPRFPSNAISHAKYTPWSFLPLTLYNEFSFFINLYFLLVALSQLIEPLRIGVLWTYMVPLGFVLTITMGKEAYDDIERRRRDAEANRAPYTVLRLRGPSASSRAPRRAPRGSRSVPAERMEAIAEEEEAVGLFSDVQEMQVKSKDVKVGDVLKLNKNDRVPADVVILKSTPSETVAAKSRSNSVRSPAKPDASLLEAEAENETEAEAGTGDTVTADGSDGETFIRTDQLDGETDWKLRLACPLTQRLHPSEFARLTVVANKPSKKVNEFVGRLELAGVGRYSEDGDHQDSTGPTGAALSIDNTAWANTVLASSATILAVVVYTGSQTRAALSTAPSRSKVGLLEYEINNLTKILCILTVALSGLLVLFQHINGTLEIEWYISLSRFLILFSSIIPISLRVYLDLGKTVYAYYIHHDKEMPEAVVRTSTIPEDLGRIEYLLSDKTGTLTQNEMDLRKVHVGTVSYANEAMDEVSAYVKQGFASDDVLNGNGLVTPKRLLKLNSASSGTRTRREIGSRVRDLVLALALCHNVTPTTEEVDGNVFTSYQASSPDEIAIVKWTESVGLRVVHRDRHSIALESVDTGRVAVKVRILDIFPFTSESKRMGILLEYFDSELPSNTPGTGEIWFYQKGADTVMTKIVAANDWLDEETANMAREGLRTLVVGRRKLSPQQYADFSSAYKEASLSLQNRDASMASAIRTHLEHNLELLGVTGVEDRLQKDVKPSLELLRNAGIKIWMLTGDKVETARCVAVSAKLVSRSQHIHVVTNLEKLARSSPTAVQDTLSLLGASPSSTALLIDGDSLSFFLRKHQHAFISLAVQLPAVIACRCSPTQKADVALLIRAFTKKRVACIGDGGNDVSMIQAADVGVGIVGKEGRQASLAADFSITQFHHLTKLLVWHGRNSYKRSAKLGQFVIHRGLVISVAQTVFSASTAFEPFALFRDWLLVGYTTAYTQLPLFSLVLDRDIDEGLANLYPELYKELTPGTSLSYKTFFKWLAVSVYQGALIQVLAQLLTGKVSDPNNPQFGDTTMVALAFTVLVLTELGVVAMEITIWHWLMLVAILATAVIYSATVPLLGEYYDLAFVWSWGFVWRTVAVLAVALVPPYVVKIVRRKVKPPSYRKVRGI